MFRRATLYRLIKDAKLVPVYRAAFQKTPLFKETEVRKLMEIGEKEPARQHSLHKAARTRDMERCIICADNHRLSAHHIIPLEQGGTDIMENLITLCGGCHKSLHGKGKFFFKKSKLNGTFSVACWLRKMAGFELAT